MSLKDTIKKAKQIERQLERQNDTDNNSSQQTLGAVKPRNYLALDPLLRKGGIHEKEDVDIIRKKRRRETKQRFRKTDWLSE